MSAEKLPVSVEDSINQAFEEIEGKNEETVTEPATREDGGAETELPENDGRSRDEAGKFTKKEKAEKTTQEVQKTEPPKYKAPKSWETDEKLKADYDKFPDHIKQALDRREKEVEHGFTKLDEERNFGKQLKEVITPYMPIITSEGGTPAKAVESLLNTAYLLRTAPQAQKVQLIQNIAQQYGVDIGQLQQPQNQLPPELQAIQDRLQGIEQKITQTTSLHDQHENARIQSEVTAFAAKPENAHFETVKAAMAPLLGSGQAKDLQEAYDMACWAHPQIRTELINRQNAEELAKRNAEIAKKKQASSSVTGSPGLKTNASKSSKSIEEELSDAYDDLTSSRI